MTDAHELTAEDIEGLLSDLGRRLDAADVDAEVYIVGGSALALTVAGRRTTHDIDAIIEPREDVLRIAQELAVERGLPDGWLNSAATPFVPPRDRKSPTRKMGGLSVRVAPPEHLLAMKLVAGRQRDVPDIHLLMDALGIETAEQAADVALDAYGEGQLDMHGGYEAVLDDAAMYLSSQSAPASVLPSSDSAAASEGDIWVEAHSRNGHAVRGHWRRRTAR